MNNLTVNLQNVNKLNAHVYIDGAEVKLDSCHDGKHTYKYSTEADVVEVVITRHFELSGMLWILMSLLFFIVGLFGIFDMSYGNCIGFNCKFMVRLKDETEINFVFNRLSLQGGNATEVQTETEVETVTNEFYLDKKVKKRKLIMFLIKLGLWLALVAIGIFMIARVILR